MTKMDYNQNKYTAPSNDRGNSNGDGDGRGKRSPKAEETNAVPYEDMKRYKIYELAKDKNIEGRSRMHKDELIAALRKLEK